MSGLEIYFAGVVTTILILLFNYNRLGLKAKFEKKKTNRLLLICVLTFMIFTSWLIVVFSILVELLILYIDYKKKQLKPP